MKGTIYGNRLQRGTEVKKRLGTADINYKVLEIQTVFIGSDGNCNRINLKDSD